MNLNKCTERAQEAVLASKQLAEDRHHSQIDVEHLLMGLLKQENGVVPQMLQKLGIDVRNITAQLETELSRQPQAYGTTQLYMSARLRNVFVEAEKEAERLKDEYVSTEHLLIAIVDEVSRGIAPELLRAHGVTRDRIYEVMTTIRGHQRVTDPNPEGKYQALEKYGRDLTEMARRGRLDPVIGRDEEIRRVIQEAHELLASAGPVDSEGQTLTVVGLRAQAKVPHHKITEYPVSTRGIEQARKGSRQIVLGPAGGAQHIPLYDRQRMGNGHEVSGPAVVESEHTTCFVTPGWKLQVDRYNNIVLEKLS